MGGCRQRIKRFGSLALGYDQIFGVEFELIFFYQLDCFFAFLNGIYLAFKALESKLDRNGARARAYIVDYRIFVHTALRSKQSAPPP